MINKSTARKSRAIKSKATLTKIDGKVSSRDLTSSLEQGHGNTQTHTRAGTTTVVDHEGVSQTVAANEMGITGGRRVENHLDNPNDNTLHTADSRANDSETASAISLNTTGAYHYSRSTTTFSGGETVLVTCTISGGTIANVGFRCYDKTVSIIKVKSISPATDGSKRYSMTLTNVAAGYVIFGFDARTLGGGSGTDTGDIQVTNWHIEDVTNNAKKVPSEFVDGVQWFTHKNGNSITSDVVTQGRGEDLPASGTYRAKLDNLCDKGLYYALDGTRRSSSWTNWSYNDISGGTHTFSGTGDPTVTLDAPTAASSGAIGAITFDFVAGETYVVSVDVTSCTNSNSADCHQYAAVTASTAGDEFVRIPNGATGRYGFRFTASTTESVVVRFGCGTTAAVSAAANLVITDPMIQKVTDLTVPFSDYTDVVLGVREQGGYTFASGDSGAFVPTSTYETFTTHNNPYDYGLGVGDSFANDSTDWPQQLQQRSYTGTFHGMGYSGGQLSVEITSAFTALIAAYDYGFVVIQGGINDIRGASKTGAATLVTMQALIVEAQAAGLYVIVINVAPWKTGGSWTSAKQTETDDYNSSLATYCTNNDIPLVDQYTLLEGTADTLNATYDSGDGLHPNAAGMIIVADDLLSKIPTDYLAGARLTTASKISTSTNGIRLDNDYTGGLDWTPAATLQGTVFIWGTYVDASNYTAILVDNTNIIFRKRIGGVNTDATKALVYAADTTYRIKWRADSIDGQDIFVDGIVGTNDSTTTDCQVGSTYEIGADGNGANQQNGSIKNVEFYDYAQTDNEIT